MLVISESTEQYVRETILDLERRSHEVFPVDCGSQLDYLVRHGIDENESRGIVAVLGLQKGREEGIDHKVFY